MPSEAVSLVSDQPPAPSGSNTYTEPEALEDGINVGSLKEVNIDSTLIIEAVNRIGRGKYNEVHSMLIYKDNKLVFEEYFDG